MADFYKKYVDKNYYHNGERYIHESIASRTLSAQMNNVEKSQKRYIDAENILIDILRNPITKFIFGKKIKEHFEKQKNFKLEF